MDVRGGASFQSQAQDGASGALAWLRSAFGDAVAFVAPYLRDAWTWLVTEGPGQAVAGASVVAIFIGLRIARAFLVGALHRKKKPSTAIRNILAQVIRRTWSLFLLLLAAVLVAPFTPGLPANVADGLRAVFGGVLILQGAVWLRQVVKCVTAGYLDARSGGDLSRGSGAAALGLISTLSGLVIWALAIVMLLGNFGVEIAPIVAGLGVGGLAIGLAAQNIFKDLFASLSIIFDQPFLVGDFISFNNGEIRGEVEKIGLKTTHLRAISGEQIIVGNAQLLDKEVSNYRRMERRRSAFDVGVVYQTSHALLERAPQIVEDAVAGVDGVRFERCLMKSFADSGIVFEVVYWVNDRRYPVFVDRQHAVLLAIHGAFEAAGLVFAYPTRTVHLETMPA
ncbi:MAG: mechanosensitive ion channel family protein [Parvularculaceae bacterium]